MAEKTPGKPRNSTSRKKETEQSSQKASTVTPINQAGLGQNQGRIAQASTSAQSESSAQDRAGQTSSRSGAGLDRTGLAANQTPGQAGAHPTSDQSGTGKSPNPIAKSAGSSPSVLNPSGSVQEGRHTAGLKPSGQELQERIRARAYELFEQRGRQEGFHQQDWAQAEAEVLSEFEREKSA